METQRLSMRNLAVIVAIASVIWTIAYAAPEKVSSCCTRVSIDEVTDPIIGYRLQNRSLPCVKAVILETQNKLLCISPRAPWVREKLRQFRAQAKNKLAPSVLSSI